MGESKQNSFDPTCSEYRKLVSIWRNKSQGQRLIHESDSPQCLAMEAEWVTHDD